VIRNAVNVPSIDAATLKVLGPYLDLGAKLGTLVQQIAPQQIDKLRITYWGRIVDLDANAVTRSIQPRLSAPHRRRGGELCQCPRAAAAPGVHVEVTKSAAESDYTELIQVQAEDPEGRRYSAEGTLIARATSRASSPSTNGTSK